MYTQAKSVFAADARRDRERRPVEARAHDHVAAGRAHHDQRQGGPQLLREQLPRPVVASARDRGRARGARRRTATACRACASSAARRIATRSSRRRSPTFLGTEDTILYSRASTRTAGCSRRCSARRTRSSPTRSTTRRSSTASACARPSGIATSTTTWTTSRPSSKATQGKRLRMIATDGVFSMDGDIARLDRDLRPRREVRRARHGRRLPRDRLRRQDRPRHARSCAACMDRVDVIHVDARQGARRRVRRLHRGPSRRSSICCASARGRTCSRTRSRRRSSRARSR